MLPFCFIMSKLMSPIITKSEDQVVIILRSDQSNFCNHSSSAEYQMVLFFFELIFFILFSIVYDSRASSRPSFMQYLQTISN